MSSAVTTLTCARRIPIPIPEPERPRTVRRTPRIGDNGTPSAHMGQLVRRRPPRDDLTPNQVLREPPDRRQRSRPIVHLLDADVDVTGAAPHGRVVKMAVQVHAPLRDPTEGEVRHQQRRVAVRRRARCIARRSPARRPPRCRVHGLPNTRILRRPGAATTRLRRFPHSPENTTSPEADDRVVWTHGAAPYSEQALVHVLRTFERPAKDGDRSRVTQVEIRPNPDPLMVLLPEHAGRHPARSPQHAQSRPPVDIQRPCRLRDVESRHRRAARGCR